MKFSRCLLTAYIAVSMFCSVLDAQQPAASASSGIVPHLVNFAGKATDAQGKILTGIVGATFAIYQDQSEGAPLWIETQNVQADAKGNYTAQLGATTPDGLPLDLFTSGEARWLGVAINGGPEQPRVLLLSVPYALKAADAETLGGKPLSAFQLAPQGSNGSTPANGSSQTAPATEQANEIVCSSGTACKTGFVPLFSSNGGSAHVSDSIVSQKGTNVAIAGTETASSASSGGVIVGNNSGTTAGSDGVDGVTSSATASGVAGINTASSATAVGVYGTSAGYGVFGTGTAYGVYGTGTTGVYGASSSDSPAIWGQNSNTTGAIADGVHGVATSANASGVAGVNTGNGVGVYGTGGVGVFGTGSSYGFQTDSNVQQARTAGGWVKAMVYVQAETAPYQILKCFNSTLAGAAATTLPCGINFTENANGKGYWDFDFGFEVDDRFLSATLNYWDSDASCIGASALSPDTVEVVTTGCVIGNGNNAKFFLVVF